MQPNPAALPPQPRTDGPKLATALASLQGKLPEIKKDRTVEIEEKGGGFHSYSYAKLSTISEAVLPLLSECGLSWTARPMLGSDGKLVLRYRCMHASGEYLEGDYPIKGEGGPQAVGGALTYARRYALCAFLGIAPEEDDDAAAAQAEEESANPRGTAQRVTKPRASKPPTGGTGKPAQRRPASATPPLPGEDDEPRMSTATHPAQPLIVAWTDIGVTERVPRLNMTGALAGRKLQSTNDLSPEEIERIAALVRQAKDKDAPIDWLRTQVPPPPPTEPVADETRPT